MLLLVNFLYKFKHTQGETLVYDGKCGNWHQFSHFGGSRDIWCELLDSDLHLIKEFCLNADK